MFDLGCIFLSCVELKFSCLFSETFFRKTSYLAVMTYFVQGFGFLIVFVLLESLYTSTYETRILTPK